MKTMKSIRLWHGQSGSTLIEALIAVFVLSFGVLVLMLTQMKSVDAALNAQNQSEVARAVDNLAEAAMANPTMQVKTVAMANGTQIMLAQNYATANCLSSIQLTNAQASSCNIDSSGKITVGWAGQEQGDTFTYTLPIGDAL